MLAGGLAGGLDYGRLRTRHLGSAMGALGYLAIWLYGLVAGVIGRVKRLFRKAK